MKEWWLPEQLKKTERYFARGEQIDVENDFGSYRAMRLSGDVKKSAIKSHNDINPDYRGRYLRAFLHESNPTQILDVGCGLGFTTAAIKKYFSGAHVTGVDVSSDAVAFASDQFKDCQFVQSAIDPKFKDELKQYDLICAFEFYPFTRSNDRAVHAEWIQFLLGKLLKNGHLVIWQNWSNEESIAVTLPHLKKQFEKYKFVEKKLPNRLIGYLPINRIFAVIVSTIIRRVLKLLGKNIANNRVLIIKKEING